MQWDHIAIALQGELFTFINFSTFLIFLFLFSTKICYHLDKHERNNHRKLSTASIDSSQHSQIQSHLLQLEESRPISRSQKRTLTIGLF